MQFDTMKHRAMSSKPAYIQSKPSGWGWLASGKGKGRRIDYPLIKNNDLLPEMLVIHHFESSCASCLLVKKNSSFNCLVHPSPTWIYD